MEKLAWIEILDRHSDVCMRYPVLEWPVKFGRAYYSDIVVDDPYVAPHHIEINPAGNNCYRILGLGSINGMTINKMACSNSEAIISANDIVRIGHTQLRIRPVDFVVIAEKPLKSVTWMRSWPGLVMGCLTLLFAHFLTLWLEYNRDEIYKLLVAPLLSDIPALLVWAGFWALIGKVLSGRANFVAHGVIASFVAALLMLLYGFVFGYIDFSLNTSVTTNVLSGVIGILVVCWLLYRHVGLVSRVNKVKLGISMVVFSISLVGIDFSIAKWSGDDDLSRMSYLRTIGPPYLLLSHGKSLDEFLQGAANLKLRLDD